MSSYIVDRKTIDIIVTAALTHSPVPAGLHDRAGAHLGRALWQANVSAVAYRYPNDRDGQRPGPIGFRDSDAEDYEWTSRPVDPADVLEAIDELVSQCAERPDWAASDVRAILESLRPVIEDAAVELDRQVFAARQANPIPRIEYDTKATAAEMRKALRAAFPGVSFSVRMARGTAYGWLDVSWTDGPPTAPVDEIVHSFESSRFDGSDDSYHHVEPTLYMIDGVPTEICYSCRGANTQRHYSDAAHAWAAPIVAENLEYWTRGPWENEYDARARLLSTTDLRTVSL